IEAGGADRPLKLWLRNPAQRLPVKQTGAAKPAYAFRGVFPRGILSEDGSHDDFQAGPGGPPALRAEPSHHLSIISEEFQTRLLALRPSRYFPHGRIIPWKTSGEGGRRPKTGWFQARAASNSLNVTWGSFLKDQSKVTHSHLRICPRILGIRLDIPPIVS